ncbi:MAG: hypothetical protein K6L73_14665 [Cellvibrionaceae bacterium]
MQKLFAAIVFMLLSHSSGVMATPALIEAKEIKRVDLTGASGMEVVSTITTYQPGAVLRRHFHHGVEALLVVQGGMIQYPGKKPQAIPTGFSLVNERGVPHAGFKVVGETSLKLFTVHSVDKGKPLYDWLDDHKPMSK